jgi:ABC-type phosphate/phosphonate transport system substrate-binding protein
MTRGVLGAFFFLVFLPISSTAADKPPPAVLTKASYQPSPPPGARREPPPLVLSAAPRETRDEGVERFAPLAEYLSAVLGRRVEYRHPGDWGVYRTQMLRGAYDIVFDGPHLTGWRVQHLDYHVLARFAGGFEFALIVRRDNARATDIAALNGRTLCAHAPPNFSAAVALALFDNPVRQPAIILTEGWANIFQGVTSGRCESGIIPIDELAQRDPQGLVVRALYRSPSYPNQAFSAGPRLTAAERERLARALTAPEADAALSAIRRHYGMRQQLVTASNAQYHGLARFLEDEWGFDAPRR